MPNQLVVGTPSATTSAPFGEGGIGLALNLGLNVPPDSDGASDHRSGQQRDARPLRVAEPEGQFRAVRAKEELKETAESKQPNNGPGQVAGALEARLQEQRRDKDEQRQHDFKQAAVLVGQDRVWSQGVRV